MTGARQTPLPEAPLPHTDGAHGLSDAEASARRARYGPNVVEPKVEPAWRKFAARFWAPVPWMLEAVIVLQVLLERRMEAAVIFVLLVFNAAVAWIQERRAQDALDALRQRLRVNARVLRAGQWRQVIAAEVVPGDIVHVRAGDFVPADLVLIDGAVSLDQSALTGESLPVDAAAGAQGYTGTIVRQGEATGEVTATGARTFFGRTAELVKTSVPPSHMQRTIFAIVERLVIFDAVLVVLVVAFAFWHRLPLPDTAVFALMLLVASVPVALPATYTLATALSGMKLAERGVLVTRLPAVEEAASMDTLVSDKTGTLTQNTLRYAGAVPLAPGREENDVLRAAALASDPATQDPLDLALLAPARERGLLQTAPPREAFHPFDPRTRRSEGVYKTDGGHWRAVKGAANVVGALCALDAAQLSALDLAERRLAAGGARVLAVAAGEGDGAASDPAPLQMLGVVGLSDPLRPDAVALIAQIGALGVRVRIATGDAAETARAIGAALGLGDRVCTAPLAQHSSADECDIYARVLPDDKHHIVAALQAAGHVTGMTGDGVNDAPALRQAELGIAVASATDVAKAAAGVVLTDAGLSGVLEVMRAGRAVHRRMLTYTLNKILKTLEITVFLTVGLMLTGGFLVSPLLIVLLLFANDFVTMSIAADNVRPAATPQRWDVRRLVAAAGSIAALSLAFSLSFYFGARGLLALSPAQSQTLAFLILVFASQASVYALRNDASLWSLPPSRWMAAASLGDIAAVSLLAGFGLLMAALPWSLIAALLGASVAFSFLLDVAKRPLFKIFAIA